MPRELADTRGTAPQQPRVYALMAAFANGDLDADGGFATRHVRDLIRLRLAGIVIREIAGRVRGGLAGGEQVCNFDKGFTKAESLGIDKKTMKSLSSAAAQCSSHIVGFGTMADALWE